MERKTKEITLFGEKLLLSERNAVDVLNLTDAIKKKSSEGDTNTDTSFYFMIAATVVQDALKVNYENMHWYNFHKKTISKKLTSKYLLENLTQKELFVMSGYVYELEGLEIKNDTDNTNSTEKKSHQV